MTRPSASGHRPDPPAATTDWSAVQYRPSSASLLRCDRRGCGAMFHDDEPGRQAHIAVFGHSPAKPPQEPTGGEPP
jgi:hypothetical protein